MKHLLPALTSLVLFVAGPAHAQSGNTATATANTPVYIAPDTSRTPLRVAAQGTVFEFISEIADVDINLRLPTHTFMGGAIVVDFATFTPSRL